MDRTKLVKTCGLLAVIAIGAAVAPKAADAGRIVVLSVKGDDTGELEELLADAIDDTHSVVASQAFERAARREGIDDEESAAGIAKVLRTLEADLLLDAIMTREDGGYLLSISVRGKNGKVKKKMSVSLDAPRLGPKGKKKVARQLLAVVDQVIGTAGKGAKPAPGDTEDAEGDEAPVVAKAKGKAAKGKGKAKPGSRADDDEDADAADEAPAKVRNRDRGRDDEDDPLGTEGDDEEGAAAADGDEAADAADAERDDRAAASDEAEPRVRRRARSGRELRRAGVLLEVGSTAMSRRLTFDTQDDFQQAPNGYRGAPVPAGHLVVEAFPIALLKPQHVAGGIGVFFEYDRVISLTTRTSEAMNVAMPTRQMRWVVGGKLRYAFGSKANRPSIALGVGYGRRAFIVDRGGLPDGTALDLPDVDYRLYEPSLMLRVPLGTERLALAAVGKGMLFQSAGAIQDQREYGAAKITGFEAEGIIDVAITSMVLLRLRGSYCLIGYDFTGNGNQTNNRDGDPDQDVGGAADRWISGSASLGVAY